MNINSYLKKLDLKKKREKKGYLILTNQTDTDLYDIVFKKLVVPNFKNIKVIDVGSHIGITSLNYILKGAELVYSFEPVPRFCKRILDINCNKIKVHNFALSNFTGKKEILISSHEVGSTICPENIPTKYNKLYRDNIKEVIDVKKLDDLHFDVSFNFMKINAEGSEYNIILGGKNFFEKNAPTILFLEIYMNKNEYDKLLSKYYKYKYSIFQINDNKNIKLDDFNLQSNRNHYICSNIKLI
jgi:FkbM family methyltransferase